LQCLPDVHKALSLSPALKNVYKRLPQGSGGHRFGGSRAKKAGGGQEVTGCLEAGPPSPQGGREGKHVPGWKRYGSPHCARQKSTWGEEQTRHPVNSHQGVTVTASQGTRRRIRDRGGGLGLGPWQQMPWGKLRHSQRALLPHSWISLSVAREPDSLWSPRPVRYSLKCRPGGGVWGWGCT
jgi:hypothetical protein